MPKKISIGATIAITAIGCVMTFQTTYLVLHNRYEKQYAADAISVVSKTNLTGSEIAYECGYTDVDYFRRLFKKYMGITAKEYRQAYCLVLPEDRVGK